MVSSNISKTDLINATSQNKISSSKTKASKSSFESFLGNSSNEVKNNVSDNLTSSQSSDIEKVIKDNFKSESVDKINKVDQIDDTQQILDDDDLSEEAVTLVTQIIKLICEYTDKSAEEVTTAMQELDMDFKDLLSNQNVTDLVCNLTDSKNVMDLLTNIDSSEMIKNLINDINDVKTDFMEQFDITDEKMSELDNLIPDDLKWDEETNILVKDKLVTTQDIVSKDELPETKNILEDSTNTSEEQTSIQSSQQTNLDQDGENSSELSQDNSTNIAKPTVETKSDDSEVKTHNTLTFTDVIGNVREVVSEKITAQFGDNISTKIVNQIIDEIKLNVKPQMTSIEMVLQPESLGKVTMSVEVSKSGVVTASITAQNEISKSAIESQISVLRENLDNQGVKVDAIEVTIASKEFEQNLEQNNGSGEKHKSKNRKNISKEDLAMINGDIPLDDEATQQQLMEQLGNSVSYLA